MLQSEGVMTWQSLLCNLQGTTIWIFRGGCHFFMTGGGICEVAVFMGHVLEKRENCRLIVQAGD
jgi:hypothetical protein